MIAKARQIALVLFVSLVPALVGLIVVSAPADAAPGCRVTYTVGSQWQGGFSGNVAVTNLGDPLTSWTLRWSFPAAGQSVTQAWGATATQSGATVTAVNVDWNGNLGTGATATFGFNGAWTTSNPVPTGFTLNGTTCDGTVTPTPTPTTPTPTPTQPATGWNPPSNLVVPLDEVWRHQESTYPNLYGFRNYGWDQVMANRGRINYCVRWDSGASVTAAQRDQIHTALARSFKKWMDGLVEGGQGWNNWPYTSVPVNVVGWAVRDRAQLQWTDSSVDITVGNIRENAPQCDPRCARFFHQDGNYSTCPGSEARHYDMSLWLTAGFGGGAGGDWGQRVGSEYLMRNLNTDNIHILLHEMGHSFGLDDFYDWTPTGVCCFVMKAGSAAQITEFDKWMFRDWWRHLKSRYGR
jgi:hypothetical protein